METHGTSTHCAVRLDNSDNLNVGPTWADELQTPSLCEGTFLHGYPQRIQSFQHVWTWLQMKIACTPKCVTGTYAFEVWALKTSPVISSYETEGLNGSVCLSPAEEQLPPPYRIQGMRQIYAAATTSEPYILLVQGICMVGNGRLAKVTGSLKTARLMIDSKNSDNWRQLLNFR